MCDDLADDILLIYQESKSLPPDSRRSMLERESRISGIFEEIIRQGMEEGRFFAENGRASLLAEDIVVLGHMWTFRRWRLPQRYSLEEYTRLQTGLVLNGLKYPDTDSTPGSETPVREPLNGEERPGEAGSGLEDLLRSLRNF